MRRLSTAKKVSKYLMKISNPLNSRNVNFMVNGITLLNAEIKKLA